MGNVNVISREDAHQTNMNTVPHNTVVGTAREPITIFVVRTRLKTAMHTLLKRKFKFGVRDRDGNTALHYAAERGHEACLKLLLDADSDVTATGKVGREGCGVVVARGS